MGVQGAWNFLKKHEIQGNPVNTKELVVPIHVDVLSLFQAYILATAYHICKDLFWERLRAMRRMHEENAAILNDEYLENTKLQRLGMRLHNKLLLYFSQSSVTLHVDGMPTVQKAHARESRQERKEVSLRALWGSVAKVLELVDKISPTKVVTRAQKDKIVRYARISQQDWKAVSMMDDHLKAGLVEELRDLGWTVCWCRGEADVCIAGQHGPITVATTDSDFLFLGVDTILRQDPQDKAVFREFSIQRDILDALGLRPEAWAAVGVVSGNDYCNNIRGNGISTNVKEIQAIARSEISSPEDILDQYCRRISTKTKTTYHPSAFRHAYDVFFRHHEDIDDSAETISFPDYEIMDMLKAVEKVLQQFKRSRRHTTVPSNPGSVDTDVQMTDAQGDLPTGTSSSMRPHKRLMSSNRYPVKTYTKKTGATPGSTAPSRRKASKKKNKKRNPPRAGFAPCSRVDRKDPLTEKPPGRKNKRQPMTIVQDKLSAKYMTITMDCGTLSRRVREGLETNYSHLSTEQHAKLADAILTTIREMVHIGTETCRMILQAIACYVAKIMTEYPTTEEEDIENRKLLFRQFDYLEGNAFMANMMSDLFCWHDTHKRGGRPRADSPANQCASAILTHYRSVLATAGKSVPILKTKLHAGLGAFFQLTGQRLTDTVQSHYRRNNLELLRRLQQFNEEWFFGEGRPIVETVDKEKGTSSKYGQVTLFWLLNTRLPPSRQLKYFPESGFADQHFVITERALLDALLAGRGKQDIVKETFGGLPTEMSNQPGDLVFKLFLSQRVDYGKTVSVVNPTIAPSAKFGQRGMLPLLGQTNSEFENRLSMLENASDYTVAKKEFREYLDDHLEDPREYQDKIDSGNRDIACRRNVLSGSISTNGHDLQLLAYSITKPKPKPGPAKKVVNKTRSELPDVKDVLKTPEQVQYQDLHHDAYVVIGIDPGVRKTATATIITSAQPDTFRNFTIPQSVHCATTKRYSHRLEKAKKKTRYRIPLGGPEASVCELESRILPVEASQATDSELLPVWQSLRTSIERRVISIMQVEEALREFYSSMLFKIKTRELKQAKTATSDKGIDRLLSEAERLRQEAGAARALIVVGDGSFTSCQGPTTHHKFISNLKKKAQVYGVLVTCGDEFRTSITCCQCGALGVLDHRSLKCSSCSQDRDRDHNAATNIARAALRLIKGEPWPRELTREEFQQH